MSNCTVFKRIFPNGVLWRLKYFRHCFSRPLRICLVSSPIFPLFDYCFAVLTDLTRQQSLRLRCLMNACIRFIFNLYWDDHISYFYSQLGWLSASDRRSYFLGYFIFCILRTGTPSYLASKFFSCFLVLPRGVFRSTLLSALTALLLTNAPLLPRPHLSRTLFLPPFAMPSPSALLNRISANICGRSLASAYLTPYHADSYPFLSP